MATLDSLYEVGSLDALAELLRSDPWKRYLAALAKQRDAGDEVERLRRAVADAKTRLSPEHTSPELQALKAKVYAAPVGDVDAVRPLLARIAAVRAALPVRRHERLFGQLETTVGQMFAATNTGTGYSNRARRARDLFTEFAGRTRIEGAATDRHGNADGTGYDLGRDGAFEGHTVHVLHFYHGEGFDFSLPRKAFERKGFRVERRTEPGTADSLRAWLADAKQLWVISDARARLGKDHLEVVRAFWQRGGALYLWGDNEPFYTDANALLGALFGSDFKMKGNTPGAKVVHELSPAGRGFHAHLVTTGLAHLFEGITVASLDEKVAQKHGFAPLLYGSAGNLITVVRDPTPASGAVMVDTAFTRLYCQWDEAGSARYVCNAGCFLAAMTLPEAEPAPEETDDGPTVEEPDVLAYDPRGAFQGACDLTAEPSPTWLVLSVEELADPLRNTGDMVLTDPLCAGAANTIFSDQVYGEQMGQWILGQGTDPFTRRPVVECLPLVDLSVEQNLRAFTTLLCKVLLGGKYLPTPARLLFFAVVDQMLDEERRTDHPEVWEYLYRQCLAGFRSTPEFADVGPKLPLLDAMAAYFSPATDEMTQVRRSFQSVCVIGRTLLREGRATPAQVAAIAKRALVKAVVGDAVAADKTAPGSVHEEVLGALYANFHGIPTLRGARLATATPSFVRDVATARKRIERDVGASLLSSAELTVVLHALLGKDLRQFTAESAVAHLLEHAPAFASVWRGEGAGDALALLNERFAPYASGVDLDEPHVAGVPPFATTYGPSVYRCTCGKMFGDPTDALTPERVLALARARGEHFRAVYRAPEASWYPGDGTLHYNLHRAVQRVVKVQYADATAFREDMIPAVAAYLRRDAKGFVCDPLIERSIRATLASYLALRRAGQDHPAEDVLTLPLKAERERRLVFGVR